MATSILGAAVPTLTATIRQNQTRSAFHSASSRSRDRAFEDENDGPFLRPWGPIRLSPAQAISLTLPDT